jgi:hypothetical protein
MLFALVYTRRGRYKADEFSPSLFVEWAPPLEFVHHWSFAAGGGMGLVEAANAGIIERAIAPFVSFFEFRLEHVHDGDGPSAFDGRADEAHPGLREALTPAAV